MPSRLDISLPPNVFEFGLLAAVSGGADSVAMIHSLARLCPPEGKLAVAHVNHGLRGKDSDEDADFVRQLADEHQLRYFEHKLGNQAGGSPSEESLRNRRYHFLIQKAEELGFRYLAAAHTADDQTETALHRILRGTGLSGLAGISSVRQMTPAVTLIRPMLHIRRKTITDFLESLEKNFRNDKTNLENKFTRNKIRNVFLPMLRKEFNPKIDEAIFRLAALAGEHKTLLAELLDNALDAIVLQQTEDKIVLDLLLLQKFSVPVRREIFISVWKRQGFPLREMNYEQWSVLAEAPQNGNGRLFFPTGISAEWHENRIVIERM